MPLERPGTLAVASTILETLVGFQDPKTLNCFEICRGLQSKMASLKKENPVLEVPLRPSRLGG